jgi:hypothetical protein
MQFGVAFAPHTAGNAPYGMLYSPSASMYEASKTVELHPVKSDVYKSTLMVDGAFSQNECTQPHRGFCQHQFPGLKSNSTLIVNDSPGDDSPTTWDSTMETPSVKRSTSSAFSRSTMPNMILNLP